MKISVLVPTYKRPEMLRAALLSIQDQSRKDLICEVLVSENSEDRRSEAVAQEFSALPLKFIRQDPPVPAIDHFPRLVAEAASEWIAWLADDDMWGRYHIEEAVRLLQKHPDAIAYAGETVNVYGDARNPISGFRETIRSHLNGRGQTDPGYEVWSSEYMLIETVLHTPLNMWAFVYRKPAYLSAWKSLADALDYLQTTSGYDSDRLFLWKLSLCGPIVVGKEISLFYRSHDTNAWFLLLKQDKEHQRSLMRKFTGIIIADAESLGIPAKSIWSATWTLLTDTAKARLTKHAGRNVIEEIKLHWGEDVIQEPQTPVVRHTWKQRIKFFIPPVILMGASSFRNRLLKGRSKTNPV